MLEQLEDMEPPKNGWIKCSEELPPCDGTYECTNNGEIPGTNRSAGLCEYDGIGFIYEGIYRTVIYWRHYKKPEKKYGKVTCTN